MERDFEYEAGRNQASRQWHMKKRKEAELRVKQLTYENEILLEALKNIAQIGKYASGSDCADIAKEALK